MFEPWMEMAPHRTNKDIEGISISRNRIHHAAQRKFTSLSIVTFFGQV
jgi:hypothetical protein